MNERDAEIERLEIRVTELESQLAISQGTEDDLRTDLHGAMAMLEKGRALVIDLIKRHFEDMDDADAQLARVRDWALYPEAPE